MKPQTARSPASVIEINGKRVLATIQGSHAIDCLGNRYRISDPKIIEVPFYESRVELKIWQATEDPKPEIPNEKPTVTRNVVCQHCNRTTAARSQH